MCNATNNVVGADGLHSCLFETEQERAETKLFTYLALQAVAKWRFHREGGREYVEFRAD